MPFEVKKSSERKTVQTSFYPVTILEAEIKDISGTDVLEVTVGSSDLPFEIRKSFWFDENKMFIIDRLFTYAGCNPTAQRTDASGEIVNTWDEKDLKQKDLVALVYQEDFLNVFDFLPSDASDEDKTRLMKRYQKYLASKSERNNGRIGTQTPTGVTVNGKSKLPW